MAPVVLVIQGAISKDWKRAVVFAISVAVGITPEMLPMIVVRPPLPHDLI
jgi:Mg2+-importing ATPase